MFCETSTDASAAAKQLETAVDQIHRFLTKQSDLPTVAARLADYAWQGYDFADPQRLEEALADLAVAEELCAANFTLPNGDELLAEATKATLRQLLLAANARKKLDAGESVDIKELTALARVAEKTVRMATHTTRPGAMRVRKEGHWAYIDAGEALAWLGKRNDFHPTRQRGNALDQPLINTADDLAAACKRWADHRSVDGKALALALGWSKTQANAYETLVTGEITDQMTHFSPAALCALGEHLGMPKPRDFARQAFRVLALKHADHQSDRQLDAGIH